MEGEDCWIDFRFHSQHINDYTITSVLRDEEGGIYELIHREEEEDDEEDR